MYNSIMHYSDTIFGVTTIEDPLIIKIIENSEFQRLKNIYNQGVPEKYYCFRVFSRYTHSIGVYLLLKNLGATYEEQVAGLVHDISHKAFSHVYDWLINDYTKNGNAEDIQDNLHLSFVETSSLKPVLTEFGLDPLKIFDLKKFTLLDYAIPYLCADRIEYSLRSLSPDFAQNVMQKLTVINERIVCTNQHVAKEFALKFLDLQDNEWGLPEAAVRYYLFSEILRYAIKRKITDIEDFDKDDNFILDKLTKSGDSRILDRLHKMATTKVLYTNDGPVKKTVFKKFRHIDPEVYNETTKQVAKLSKLDPEFQQRLERSRTAHSAGVEFYPLW
jgi:uncharacterized protein